MGWYIGYCRRMHARRHEGPPEATERALRGRVLWGLRVGRRGRLQQVRDGLAYEGSKGDTLLEGK